MVNDYLHIANFDRSVHFHSGNGTTSAVELLIDCLGLKHHILAMDLTDGSRIDDKPVIFVGPFEHHSNLLPWRELGHVDIEIVNLDPRAGNMDLEHLKLLLEQHSSRKVKIGAFSAASNVTGVIANDIAITALLHQYGALSIWDYATGASYLDVNMNPRHPDYSHAPELLAKDAVVLSGHKLLGGVGTPGVLIIKKHLVSQQNPPSRSGGGTVFYVTADHHRFLSNRIERFEGGTPNIVGIWRLGLAVSAKSQLKKQFEQLSDGDSKSQNGMNTKSTVLDYDLQRARRIQQELSKIQNLVLMDALYAEDEKYVKLPVFSFLIKCGARFLHYNYVCAILNDLFGIQSRGGCQCAGPFAQYLLGLHGQVNTAVEECLVYSKDELLRPGFSRLSLPTFGTTKAIEDYVIKAMDWVARNGWKLMHVYRCNHRTGEWRHKSRPGAPLGKTGRKWLSHYRTSIKDSFLLETSCHHEYQAAPTLEEALRSADDLLKLVAQDHSSLMQAVKMSHEADADASSLSVLRWYVYPKEVAVFLQQGWNEVPGTADRSVLLGAVRPVAWFPVHDMLQRTEVGKTNAVRLDPGMNIEVASEETNPKDLDSKELADASQTNHFETETSAVCEDMMKSPVATDYPPGHCPGTAEVIEWVSFQDGEHSGQAPIEEIKAGFEDGELSSTCMLYDANCDEWERIDLFLVRKHGLIRSASAKVSSTSANSCTSKILVQEEALATKHAPPATPASVSIVFSEIPLFDKHEKKKPQRDSAAWGHGSMVLINQPTNSTSHEAPPAKQKRCRHIKPPPKLMRLVTQAMIQWDMLEEGDRLLLGLSGGKDSLSLLHVLLEFQKKLPINFDIEVCTIDPMTPSFDPSPLIPYVESLGLKYHYIRDNIVDRANNAGKDGEVVSSLCSFCARMKRGHLYACARKNNCNKLVLAQHLDDLAESFMMSVMHNGFLRTMKGEFSYRNHRLVSPLLTYQHISCSQLQN